MREGGKGKKRAAMVYIFRVVSERRGKGASVSGIDLIMPRREHPGGRHANSGGKPSLQCVYPPLAQGRTRGGGRERWSKRGRERWSKRGRERWRNGRRKRQTQKEMEVGMDVGQRR